jgi:hypothetical protein
MKAVLIAGSACLALALAAPAQDKAPASRPDLASELAQLETEYRNAMDEYYRPYREAKSEEEEAAIRLDPEKNPSGGFRARYRDLATRGRGTKVGLEALKWLLQDVNQKPDGDPSALLDEAVAHHLALPEFAEFVSILGWYTQKMPPERRNALFTKIHAEATSGETKASALLSLADAAQGGRRSKGDPKAARALLERVIKEHPETKAAARADGRIFEQDHLKIGSAPPDMEAVDQDGKKFKLSDYRGKVVVLDFWGYW